MGGACGKAYAMDGGISARKGTDNKKRRRKTKPKQQRNGLAEWKSCKVNAKAKPKIRSSKQSQLNKLTVKTGAVIEELSTGCNAQKPSDGPGKP
ncbi:hypothetical protein Tco_0884647 [Tanacetum coccineum]